MTDSAPVAQKPSRRKLIFFTTADPRTDPGALFRAYHFANVAARSGLEAEVRLAGEAVAAADTSILPDTEVGRDVRARIEAAAADGPFLVSLWPFSVDAREVSEEQVAKIGGRLRVLGDILTEVADGESEMIFVGG